MLFELERSIMKQLTSDQSYDLTWTAHIMHQPTLLNDTNTLQIGWSSKFFQKSYFIPIKTYCSKTVHYLWWHIIWDACWRRHWSKIASEYPIMRYCVVLGAIGIQHDKARLFCLRITFRSVESATGHRHMGQNKSKLTHETGPCRQGYANVSPRLR